MYKLICQKPGRFLSVQIAVISSFPQMFVELGTYNFSQLMKNVPFQHFFFKLEHKGAEISDSRGMFASKRKLFFVIEYE